jgi:hypothetical protein
MGSRYLTDLADVCRAAGLVVQEEAGWQTRARGSGGFDSGRPNHVMVHHTASGPNNDGQPDVNYQCYGADARPIANLYLSRSGKVWIEAAGATNTNGSGTDPCGIVPLDSMNSHAIGIEAGNNGVGEVWPAAQQTAYITLVNALCSHYGIGIEQVHSHIEYAPGRKIDPAGPAQWPPINSSQSWDMNAFRADLGIGPIPPGPLPPPMEVSEMLVLFTIHDAAQPGAVYVSNGLWYRWIPDGAAYDALVLFLMKRGMPTTMESVSRTQLYFAGAYIDLNGNIGQANPNL